MLEKCPWRPATRVQGFVVIDDVMGVQADLLVATDALQTFLESGDQGFEDPEPIFNMGTSFNTGTLMDEACFRVFEGFAFGA